MIFGTVFVSSFFQTGICRRHLGLNNNKNRPFYEALKVHVFHKMGAFALYAVYLQILFLI
jgi:hypothetical protein